MPPRKVHTLSFSSLDEMLTRFQPRQRYFTLLLAWDAPEDMLPILPSLLRPLVDRGLVYFCAWGEHCEQVHDAVDCADIQRIERSGSEDYIVMTTWHSDKPIQEALWYFKYLALPTEEPYSSALERFAVSISDDVMAESIQTYFAPRARR